MRWHLVLLVGAVGLAFFTLAGLAAWRGHDIARQFHQHVLLDNARDVVGLVDREFATGAALLRGLAVSPQLAAGDYDGFDAQARAAQKPGTWIVAFDRKLRHVVSTAVPRSAFASAVGERLPPPELIALVRDVFATGQVRISDVFDGPVLKRSLVAVVVPALGADGAVAHAVMLAISVDRIAAMLTGHHLPVDMQAAVRDGGGRAIGGAAGGTARPGVADEVLTVPAPPGDEAGGATVVAFARSPDSPYVGVVSVPEERFDAPARAAALDAALAGGLIGVAGCLAALALARRLATSLRTLSTPGGPAPMVSGGARCGLHEVADLARELAPATAGAVATGRCLPHEKECLRADGDRVLALALTASERRLALAQEAAGLGTWEWTIASDEKIWSEQQCRIYGVDPAEPAPRLERWLSLVVPEDRERARAVVMEALATRGEYRMEFSIRRASDGAVRRMFAAGRGERDKDGRIHSMVGVSLDITEERVTRAALRSAEARLLLAQETAGIGFFDRDVATGAIAVTPTWLAICGLPPSDAQGLRFDDWLALLHPADRDRIAAQAAAAMETGAPFETEFRILRADTGEVRWLETRGCRIEPGHGSGPRVIGVTRDITAGKAAEAVLTDANARLEARVAERTRTLTDAARALAAEIRRGEAARAALLQAQKLGVIGELTSGVVHDFNNVLTAIAGSFEMLERRIDDPACARVVSQGQRAIARAGGLIRQLLTFARKADMLRPAVIDPARMLREAGEFLRQGAGPTVACAVDAADDVWPVLADPHQLEVALLNLVVNARDAMPEGGTITVSVRNGAFDASLAGRDMVVLTVRDTGAGMSGEVLARAAEPFFTTKAEGRGTGLGLAMVQEFAVRVGGALRIESRVGVGTAVSIVLPRADGVVLLAAPRPAGEAAQEDDGAVILLVEANEPVRMATAAFLRESGYTVIDAAEAETGLVLVSALDRLDLVLADAGPPEGAALAARIRLDRPGTPILSMTAGAGAAFAGGAIGHSRPSLHADLAAAVAAILGCVRAGGEAFQPPMTGTG